MLFLRSPPAVFSQEELLVCFHSNPQIRVPADPQNPEIMKIEFFGFPQKQIEKLEVQIEAETFYGVFEHIFSVHLP